MYNFTLKDDFLFGQPFKTLMKLFSHSSALGKGIKLTADSCNLFDTHYDQRTTNVISVP